MPRANRDANRTVDRERAREKIRDSQRLPPMPPPKNPSRRAAAERSFKFFCEAYLPNRFPLAWSRSQLAAIEKIQQSVTVGGLFGFAMPRGEGKTTLMEAAVVWSIATGRREFVLLVAASQRLSLALLESIKGELQRNERLAEDYPEMCLPILGLEGEARRCGGQRDADGNRTESTWGAEKIVLATLPDHTGKPARCSGAVIQTTGIEGSFRGLKARRPDGRTVRPDLVIVDDPQTDESARSPSQVASREAVLAGAVLGLAGPGMEISGICACTVIARDDLSDRLLDRKRNPDWKGERSKMLISKPLRDDLWAQYAEIRADSLRADRGIEDATEFYRRHRAEMDAGAEVSWPERFKPQEISGIQHAMNLMIQNEAAFMAEYQNDPLATMRADEGSLEVAEIVERLSTRPRGVAPDWAEQITAFIDVQGEALFWLVAGWSQNFRGCVLDYGVYPEQPGRNFTLSNLKRKLSDVHPGSLEARLHAGLTKTADDIFGRAWVDERGSSLSVGRIMVDANWNESTTVVYEWIKTRRTAGTILPSHGRHVSAISASWSQYKPKEGDRIGDHWRIPAEAPRGVRYVTYEVNRWKSFVRARLQTPVGDPGGLLLFGSRPNDHLLLAEHFTAEIPVSVKTEKIEAVEWKLRPNRDNHWWDCIVGAAVAASIGGCVLPGGSGTKAVKKTVQRERIKLSDIQAARRGAGK